jgi:serine/threonine protein kinase
VDGETQIGPFAIERELGRGGMGVVYAARQDGRRVALKVSIDDLPERDRKHFLEEAALLSRISHPGVVEILDSGLFDDGRPYLVMPLLDGKTLADRLQRGRIETDLALRLFAQLAGAVAALHEVGIVHRDIKSENVMYLEQEERLVLLDFGIAREIDRPASTTTRMNLVRGTPGCMAPERFFGTRASVSSDVYELAVVLYAMVAGQLPWDEPTDPEARLRPRHPGELGVELPVGLGHILLEALSTRPDRRPSARELAVRVRAVEGAPLTPAAGRPASDRDTVALPAPPLMESPPPRARSISPPSDETPRREVPALVWFAGALLVTGLAVGGSIWARTSRVAAISRARTGFGKLALDANLRTGAVALAGAAGDPGTEKVSTPLPGVPPTATPSAVASTLPVTTGGTMASPPPGTAAQAPAGAAPANMPWCTRLMDLFCTPAARKLPDGDARCAARRAELGRTKQLPDDLRARAESSCRDSFPAMERSIKSPQSSEAAEDMPWCKRVAAAYCTPEVKNTYGGDGLCAQGTRGFYGNYLSRPPEARAAQNEKCAQVLPGVIQAMREHAREFGPGGAASARMAARAAPPGPVPGVGAPPGPGAHPGPGAPSPPVPAPATPHP